MAREEFEPGSAAARPMIGMSRRPRSASMIVPSRKVENLRIHVNDEIERGSGGSPHLSS